MATHGATPRSLAAGLPDAGSAALLSSVPGGLSMLLQTNRSAERGARSGALTSWVRDPGNAALLATSVAWAAGLALILRHRIFVTNDSLSNYIHVWYVADRFWHGHGVPLHVPVMGHGDAYAFPYGFLPWFMAALLRPLLGDWIVTASLVAGFLGVVATMWWAFPKLRVGWWFAICSSSPCSSRRRCWASCRFSGRRQCSSPRSRWRNDRVLAALLLGAAQATHPAVILPIAGVLVLARLHWEPQRSRLLACYAASLAIAAPATWLTLASPTIEDVSAGELLANFFETVILRAIVVAAPFIVLVVMRTALRWMPAAIFIGLIALNVVIVPARQNKTSGARSSHRRHRRRGYIDSADFVPGATYRILRVGDGGRDGDIVRNGGCRLRPFPESIDRRSFPPRRSIWRSSATVTSIS
jgi:hypothetical protein